MSNDVVLVPADVELGDPPDWDVLMEVRMGSREEILGRLAEVFPDVDLRDPQWPVLEGEGFSIVFQLTDEHEDGSLRPISAVVHDWTEGHERALARLCKAMNWRAYSAGDDAFLDFERENLPNACPKCGRKLRADSKWCYYCGWRPG